MDSGEEFSLGTFLQHFGDDPLIEKAIVSPLFQNSNFSFDSYDELHEAIENCPGGPPHHYSRFGNPTLEKLEQTFAKLEECESAKVVGTGMAAIGLATMSCVKTGSHIIAPRSCYSPTKNLFTEYLQKFQVTTTYVEGDCTQEIADAIRPETSLIYMESPSSILFKLQDLEAIAKIAKERGITTAIDNTYSTPLFQKPHTLGIDLVLHSGTKYIGGHYDAMAGIICGSKERIDKIIKNELNFLGSILSPFAAWLLMRGLRTLEIRMKAHQEIGNEITAWLQEQPQVEVVHHLGLPNYPQKQLFQKQMMGSGSVFSFEPRAQELDKVKKFCEALKLFHMGLSWGGFSSMVLPAIVESPTGEKRHVIRLFCGLEDPKDLKKDLERALQVF